MAGAGEFPGCCEVAVQGFAEITRARLSVLNQRAWSIRSPTLLGPAVARKVTETRPSFRA